MRVYHEKFMLLKTISQALSDDDIKNQIYFINYTLECPFKVVFLLYFTHYLFLNQFFMKYICFQSH